MLSKNNLDLCEIKLQNLIDNKLEPKIDLKKEKKSLFTDKKFYHQNLENRIIQIIDLVKNKKNIKINVNLNSNKNLNNKIIKTSNNENSKKEDITNKRKGSEITEIEEIKLSKKKNIANFFIRQKNIVIPVYIPKIKNALNLRKKKIKKNPLKNLKANFSIFRSNNSVILNNVSLKTEKVKFEDKIQKFKLFWKNKKSFYPFAFLKKKVEVNNLFFCIEEIFDVSRKQILL